MPFVKLYIPEGKDQKFAETLSGIVHRAMIDTIQAPPTSLYHHVTRVKKGELFYFHDYKGWQRSDNVVVLEITMKEGRTPEQKQAMYERITLDLQSQLGVRPEDLFIIVTDSRAENWYFGKTMTNNQ